MKDALLRDGKRLKKPMCRNQTHDLKSFAPKAVLQPLTKSGFLLLWPKV